MWDLDHKEGWTLKNWCFQTVVMDKTLVSPWKARRSNQSVLKEINPEYSLERLMLKLKLQCSGHLMRRAESLEKTLMLEKIEGRRRRGQWRMRWLDGILAKWTCVWQAQGDRKGQGSLVCCSPWGRRVRQLGEWTTTTTENLQGIWNQTSHQQGRQL